MGERSVVRRYASRCGAVRDTAGRRRVATPRVRRRPTPAASPERGRQPWAAVRHHRPPNARVYDIGHLGGQWTGTLCDGVRRGEGRRGVGVRGAARCATSTNGTSTGVAWRGVAWLGAGAGVGRCAPGTSAPGHRTLCDRGRPTRQGAGTGRAVGGGRRTAGTTRVPVAAAPVATGDARRRGWATVPYLIAAAGGKAARRVPAACFGGDDACLRCGVPRGRVGRAEGEGAGDELRRTCS